MKSIKAFLKSIVPRRIINLYHLLRAVIAASIFGFPGKRLQVFGVTGTNGKTTTCFFLYSILRAARHKVGMATTVRFDDGKSQYRNEQKMTTLNPFSLQDLLRKMLKNRVTNVVLEVTSHALHQNRVWGVDFDTVIFTNLTHDHLDYHKNKEEYLKSKGLLFAKPHRVSVINGDDKMANFFVKFPSTKKFIYSLESKNSQTMEPKFKIMATGIRQLKNGTSFLLHLGDQKLAVELKLRGLFNVQNALAAAAAAWGANINTEAIKVGLETLVGVPGRLETLDFGQTFKIFLDYAHTPDALKKVFEVIRQDLDGRLIHVGGATGNRDKSKRPLLGALAGQFADVVLITNEDPDNEDPWQIIEAVAVGVPKGGGREKQFILGKNFFKFIDRTEAITRALSMAKPKDVVLVTGKGDETSMIVNGELIPYSDREVIESFFKPKDGGNKFREEFLQ